MPEAAKCPVKRTFCRCDIVWSNCLYSSMKPTGMWIGFVLEKTMLATTEAELHLTRSFGSRRQWNNEWSHYVSKKAAKATVATSHKSLHTIHIYTPNAFSHTHTIAVSRSLDLSLLAWTIYNLESCLSKSARARSSSLIPESAVRLGIVWRESNLKDKEDTRLRPRSKNTITEKEIADDRRDVTPRECSKRVYSIFSLSFCE